MSDNNPFDFGKQAKDIAEATNVSVDAVKKLGNTVDSMFGNVISNGLGLLSDKLAYYRFEKCIELNEKVEKKLKERGVKTRFVPVAFGLPILEKATVEDDEVLQEKWANLLTNARDASYEKPIRRNYTSILADMEAVDCKVLDFTAPKKLGPDELFARDKLSIALKIDPNVLENSVRNLMRLGLLRPGVVSGGIQMGDHKLSSYKDTELFSVTPMGADFYFAVNDGAEKPGAA